MGRVWRWFAAWGLDVLVVAAAAASAIGTLLRTDADRPDGLQLWFEVGAISVVLLALCARRGFPFLAPAFVWVGSAALSFLDRQLITKGRRDDASGPRCPLPALIYQVQPRAPGASRTRPIS